MTDFTENFNIPLPGATAVSRRLADIQSVRAAIIAMDAAIVTAIANSGPNGLSEIEVNVLIDAKINLLKGGVVSAGDTLSELYGLYVSLNGNLTSLSTVVAGKVDTNLGNVAGGYPVLDGGGKIDPNQLPSYIDDVLEFANEAALPLTGESGKLYVTASDEKVYRWSGSGYVVITSNGVNSVNGRSGIIILNKADVGLGNVDNTGDLSKPVSTAQNAAINDSASTTLGLAATDATIKANNAQAASAPIAHVGAGTTAHAEATITAAGFMSAADKVKINAAITKRELDVVSFAADYNVVKANSGVMIKHSKADTVARTVVIPSLLTMGADAFVEGTILTFVNPKLAGPLTITCADTINLENTASTGTRTLATNSRAAFLLVNIGGDGRAEWLAAGNGLT
jgi:hypothetical protein